MQGVKFFLNKFSFSRAQRRRVKYWLDFVWQMTAKEIKARYKKAAFGFLWIILNPLLQMAAIGVIFQFFIPIKIDNYFLYLFAGLLPWNFFAQTLSKATPIIVNERGLIKKAAFPREAIVLSVVLSNLFHTMIGWGMLLILMVGDKIFLEKYAVAELLFYILRVGLTVPLLVLVSIFTTGCSLLLAALNVRYRDINFAVQALLPIWFYATPIVYSLNLLPDQITTLLYLNPLTGLMELIQALLFHQNVQEPGGVVFSVVSCFFVLVIGWVYFAKEAGTFDDWI
jgi:lipopolysaccharide transport system permease protein